jgi:hypothetical protein
VRGISEVIRLKNTLERQIIALTKDAQFHANVNNSQLILKELRDRKAAVESIQKNYLVMQWLMGELDDGRILNTED